MDTGFNYYHGADPSEYDLVVSNSEGGLPRLLELGARRAETVFWGADPEFFAPQPVEKEIDVFFYGYGDKFRREWTAAMMGEPSRAAPEIDFALGGRDFRGDVGNAALARRRAVQRLRARDLGCADQPQRDAALARDGAAARRPAGRSSSPRRARRSSRTRTRASSVGSSRGARSSSSRMPTQALGCLPRAARRSGPGRRRWVPGRASGCSTSTRTCTGRVACSTCSALRRAVRRDRRPDHRDRARPQRGGGDRRRGRRDPCLRARRSTSSSSTTAHSTTTSAIARAARCRRRHAAVQPRDRRQPSRPASSTRSSTAIETAVRLDGDGQHDPGGARPSCSTLIERDEADIVTGSRFVDGNGTYRPAARAASASSGSRTSSPLLTRQRVTDTTSGFQALNRAGSRSSPADYPSDYPEVEATRARLQAPPAARRGAGADARAGARSVVDHHRCARSTTCSR